MVRSSCLKQRWARSRRLVTCLLSQQTDPQTAALLRAAHCKQPPEEALELVDENCSTLHALAPRPVLSHPVSREGSTVKTCQGSRGTRVGVTHPSKTESRVPKTLAGLHPLPNTHAPCLREGIPRASGNLQHGHGIQSLAPASRLPV